MPGAAFAGQHSFTAGLLLMLAGFFDLIDGVVARQQGISSNAGAFFDSSIDRLSDLLIFGRLGPLPHNLVVGLAVWGLYYFGQMLICLGVARALEPPHPAS